MHFKSSLEARSVSRRAGVSGTCLTCTHTLSQTPSRRHRLPVAAPPNFSSAPTDSSTFRSNPHRLKSMHQRCDATGEGNTKQKEHLSVGRLQAEVWDDRSPDSQVASNFYFLSRKIQMDSETQRAPNTLQRNRLMKSQYSLKDCTIAAPSIITESMNLQIFYLLLICSAVNDLTPEIHVKLNLNIKKVITNGYLWWVQNLQRMTSTRTWGRWKNPQ